MRCYKRRMLAVALLALLVTLACAAVTATCFAIALYELLNGEAQGLRLDSALALPALVNVAVETTALAGGVLSLPWRSSPGHRADTAANRPLVVLVTTWPLGAASVAPLRHRLRRDGWRDVRVVASPLRGDLAAHARALQTAVDDACAGSPRPVVLVGHGTGGVVCRAYLRWLGGTERVAKLVTLAAPHQGSKLYALTLGGVLRDLRPGADALAELGADDPVPARVDCTAIYGSFDVTVVPSRNAYWAGAGNIEVEGAGHFTMPWSRRVYALLRENLEYAAPPAAGALAGTDTPPAA